MVRFYHGWIGRRLISALVGVFKGVASVRGSGESRGTALWGPAVPTWVAPCLCMGFGLAAMGMLLGCRGGERAKLVDLHSVEPQSPASIHTSDSRRDLRVSISSMVSPEDTRVLYKELMEYVGERSGRRVILKQRRTYEEVNNLLAQGELDLAFLCSAQYVEAHDKFGAKLLVAPVVHGKTLYRSYIIVGADSNAHSLQDLQGKKFAFSDPMSNTGCLVPTYLLAQMGQSPETFFASCIFTGSHDNSIQAVSEGLVDGAAVDSLIYDSLRSRDPDLVRSTRAIVRSQPFGIPPLVVPPGIDPKLEQALRSVFLAMHEDADGRAILEKLDIERFVLTDDAAYDGVRKVHAFLERQAHTQAGSAGRR